jgi:hypothetical protein
VKLLDRIFGERLPPDDHAVDEGERARELQNTLVKHRLTLQAVGGVLSDSQKAVAGAIDDTADAIEKSRRRRRR